MGNTRDLRATTRTPRTFRSGVRGRPALPHADLPVTTHRCQPGHRLRRSYSASLRDILGPVATAPSPTIPPMTPREITTPDELPEEGTVELTLRPQRLAGFIGRTVKSLRIYIDAARPAVSRWTHPLLRPPGRQDDARELMARARLNIRHVGPGAETGRPVGTLTTSGRRHPLHRRGTPAARSRSSCTRRWRLRIDIRLSRPARE